MATRKQVREYVINYLASVRGVDPSEIDDDTPIRFRESHDLCMYAMMDLQAFHVMSASDGDTVRDLVNTIVGG